MKVFQCQQCRHPIFFENTACEKCGSTLGYLSEWQVLSALVQAGGGWEALAHPGEPYRYCQNHGHGVCNWVIPASGEKELCPACELNRTIPNLDNPRHLAAWRKLEYAKHRLIYSLQRFGLPLKSKADAPETGLCFDFLSDERRGSQGPVVLTGHFKGRITINLAEADDAQREATRAQMAEPYRTLIGHFRHEIGHYYWERLVRANGEILGAFRRMFGDDRADYAESLRRYHDQGPPSDWQTRFLSAYSTSHPWEEWAETWAHYFHMVDILETAHAFRIRLSPDLDDAAQFSMHAQVDPYQEPDVEAIIAAGIPLALAINSLNRSMGLPDLYPFILPPPVMEKFRFIHRLINNTTVSP